MNAQLKQWAHAEERHTLLIGRIWRSGNRRGVPVPCEGCGAIISLFPAAKGKLGPHIHAVCYERCVPELRKLSELEFGGWIENNVLPKGLA